MLMLRIIVKILLIVLISGFNLLNISAQTDYSLLIPNPKSILTKEQLVKDKETLNIFHPNAFNSFPETEWDSLIDVVAKELPLVPIKETEKILIRRKLLDRVTYEDPHLRFLAVLGKEGTLKIKMKNIKALPFTFINISDTLLVDKGYDDSLIKGDRILKINDINVIDFLETSYRDRYMSGYALQTYHHFTFSSSYKIKLIRNTRKKEVCVSGLPLTNDFFHKLNGSIEEKIINEQRVGYFRIDNFDYNKYLIKRLGRFIDKVKKKGYKNIIIDLRKNPGGNGDRFDELFSMFTNKTQLPYLKGAKLKISKATYKDYSYTEEDFGRLVDLPDSLIIKTCPLDNSKYKGNINYYILISRNTGSIASSFANIMQYNNIGLLVGEPLAHNALNYGEVITAERDNSFWTISTVENFENTKAVDGILIPDISIPFVASEYIKGGDPVLEKCLKYIDNSTNK